MKALSTRNLFRAAAMLLIGTKAVPYVIQRLRARNEGGIKPDSRRIRHTPDRYDQVTEASMESFPASDSPSFSPGAT